MSQPDPESQPKLYPSPGLAAPWWLTRAESMWEAGLVKTRPFSAVWSHTIRTLIRSVRLSKTAELSLQLSLLSYFSGQSCRTWKRFVALSAEFWWTDQYTSILIKTSELNSTKQADKIRRCILNGFKMIKLYNKQPKRIFSFRFHKQIYLYGKLFGIIGILLIYVKIRQTFFLPFFLCLVCRVVRGWHEATSGTIKEKHLQRIS